MAQLLDGLFQGQTFRVSVQQESVLMVQLLDGLFQGQTFRVSVQQESVCNGAAFRWFVSGSNFQGLRPTGVCM